MCIYVECMVDGQQNENAVTVHSVFLPFITAVLCSLFMIIDNYNKIGDSMVRSDCLPIEFRLRIVYVNNKHGDKNRFCLISK